MSESIELAKAYVQVIPTTKGITSNLQTAFDDASTKAGKSSSGKFSSAFSAGLKATAGIATAVAGAIAAGSAAVVNATTELAEYGDEIDKASQKMGVSSKFYQEWDAVLQHSGTSMSSMSGTFKTLAKVANGATDAQAEALTKLGLSMDSVSSMSTEDLFSTIITQLQSMEEGTERTYLATTLLGRGGAEMGALLNTSAEDTQKMIDTVNELGGVLGDDVIDNSALFQDNLQDMKTALEGVKNSLIADFLPGMNDVMAGLTAFISGDDGGLEQLNDGIADMVNKLTENMPKFLEVAKSIIEGLGKALVENLPALADTSIEIIGDFAGFLIDNLPMIAETAITIIMELANALSENLPTALPYIVDVLIQVVEILTENAPMLIDASIAILTAMAEGLIKSLPILIKEAPKIITELVSAIAHGYIEMGKVGINLIEGLWEGIKSKITWLKDKIADFATGILDGIKSVFDINSPSKETAWIGQMLDEGMAQGISDYASDVVSEAAALSDDVIDGMAGMDANVSRELSANYTVSATQIGGAGTGSDLSQVVGLLAKYLPEMANTEIKLDGKTISQVVFKQGQKEYKKTGNSPVYA